MKIAEPNGGMLVERGAIVGMQGGLICRVNLSANFARFNSWWGLHIYVGQVANLVRVESQGVLDGPQYQSILLLKQPGASTSPV